MQYIQKEKLLCRKYAHFYGDHNNNNNYGPLKTVFACVKNEVVLVLVGGG